MKKGMIVISKSGRDKRHFFVVMKADDECVYIADGKLRKIENLKKKNIKHLQHTNIFINLDEVTSNKQLHKKILELTKQC